MTTTNPTQQQLDDCDRIFHQWDRFAREGDVERLLALYAEDAVFESPLVPAILDDKNSGVLRGHREILPFIEEGTSRRPNELVRWYRTGQYFTDGKTLIWEYPRETPDGDQIGLIEVMEIRDGHIQHHRIYWDWKGSLQIAPSLQRAAHALETAE